MKHGSFWAILLVTALVGLAALLSEHEDYPLAVHIEWTGYDTARYAVVTADSVLPLTLNSNYFLALARYFDAPRHPYTIPTKADTVVKVNKLLIDDIVSRLQYHGIHGAVSAVEQISLKIAPRQSKILHPTVKDLQLTFDPQCGLAGEPRLSPDTVILYGSQASLDRINSISTAPATIEGLKDTSLRTLALEPVWEKFPDVRVSTPQVELFIPVARFTEKTFSVPVRFDCSDDAVRVRLYPERVDVTLWVSESDYDRILPDMVHASVQYPPDAPSDESLAVRITSFPANTRVKSVFPSTLQYVIIK